MTGFASPDFDSAEHQTRLKELYRDFEAAGMTPLWLTREGLMPFHPQPRAVPHLWRWADLLLTPGWAFHGHQNVSDAPMAWLDGLDIPLVAETDQGFFAFDILVRDRDRG